MSIIITTTHHKHDLYSFIYKNLSASDYAEFRDVDSLIDIISNLLEHQSRLLTVLYEKGVISESELKQVLGRSDFEIEEEDARKG